MEKWSETQHSNHAFPDTVLPSAKKGFLFPNDSHTIGKPSRFGIFLAVSEESAATNATRESVPSGSRLPQRTTAADAARIAEPARGIRRNQHNEVFFMKQIHGIFAVTVTHFQENGEIDYAACAKHINWLIESGVHGLLPLGATGRIFRADP